MTLRACSLAVLAVSCGLAVSSCVVFPSGERRVPVRIEEGALAPARYRLINWGDDADRPRGAMLLAHMRGAFRDLSEDSGARRGWNVDVVLASDADRGEIAGFISRRPLRFLWNVFDDALVGGTRFVFPWIRTVERTVTFRVWHGTRLLCSYSYQSDYFAVGALSSLLAIPWSESSYVVYDPARLARLFVMDASEDGFFKDGAPGVTGEQQCRARQ